MWRWHLLFSDPKVSCLTSRISGLLTSRHGTAVWIIKRPSLPANEGSKDTPSSGQMWQHARTQGLNSRPRVDLCSHCLLCLRPPWAEHHGWKPYGRPSFLAGSASQEDHPVVPRQAEAVICMLRCDLPATAPPRCPDLKIHLEMPTLSRWHTDLATSNRIKRGGTRALGRRCWELEMHVMSCVYGSSAEYCVCILELTQAHQMSAIATLQRHWSNFTLKGDSPHNENPPMSWRRKQASSGFP